VDRHDVYTLARERVQIHRQCGGESLALARAHFRNLAIVKGDAAYHLHIEVPHAEDSFTGFAHNGERLRQQVVQRFTLLKALPELCRLALESVIAQLFELGLQCIDLRDLTTILLQYAVVTTTEKRF